MGGREGGRVVILTPNGFNCNLLYSNINITFEGENNSSLELK